MFGITLNPEKRETILIKQEYLASKENVIVMNYKRYVLHHDVEKGEVT